MRSQLCRVAICIGMLQVALDAPRLAAQTPVVESDPFANRPQPAQVANVPIDPFAAPTAASSAGATSTVIPPPLTAPWTDPAVVAASAEIPAVPTVAAAENPSRLDVLEQKVNGMLQSATGATYPSVKVNGVFQTDTGWVSQDAVSTARYGTISDGTDFRRARLAASGALTEVNNYFFQMDFAFFGRPTFTDLWVEQTDLPILGNVRVGQWKQPFSLEVVSSFRYTTFVERSVLFQAFTPFRHLGIGFYNRNQALTSTWAASAFAAGNDQYGGSIQTAGGIGTAERITWLPQYDEPSEGRYYLHLGLGHYFSAPNNRTANFRTIPEMFIGSEAQVANGNIQPVPGNYSPGSMPFFVATGNLTVHNFNVFGSEVLWVRGPWSLQAEGMLNVVNQVSGDTLLFSGGYAQVGYFLTGEHRPYDRKAGAIDRIKPFENFFRVRSKQGGICRGLGAWELAGRVSTLNLKGDYPPPAVPVTVPPTLTGGGIITDFTLGLNWYLNAYTKCQFNYIHSHTTDRLAGVALTDLFDLRVQMDF